MGTKFEGVDILDFLGQVVELHTQHYKEDFDVDKELIQKVALSGEPEERRLLWMSRPCGTYCLSEREVYLQESNENKVWMFYHEDKLRAIQDSKRQLYERYALGEIDLETYRSQKAVYDAELVQAKNVHAAITAQTKQIQSDYEARLKQREIVQEVGSTDVLTQSLIDRLINRVYVFPGDRIEIEYVTQDFLGTEKSGKEA